ncbi:MAG: Phage protein [Clostridium sp.]|jgi:signal transduction histidine kinase
MKHRKNFYLEDAAIAYVRQFQKDNHLSSFTAALSQIIREHQHRNDIPAAEFFAKEMAKQIAEELKTPLTRIRLGVNNADRNSDILLLLVNTLLAYSPYQTLFVDDTPQLAKARQIEKDRIANFRQKKLDAAKKKMKKPQETHIPEEISEDDLL